jgi:hypothetical protein
MTDIAFSRTVKAGQFADHGLGLPRDQPFEISTERGKQLALVNDL